MFENNCQQFKVSIIMPMHNSSQTLQQSVASVISQSYENWELVVCDDCSDDNSVELLESFCDSRIKLVRNPSRKGAGFSRINALRFCRGRFIAFLDSDDIWSSEKLLIQVTFMIEKNIVFSYGDYFVFNSDCAAPSGVFSAPVSTNYQSLLKSCGIGCLTVMIDRFELKELQLVDYVKEDYASWLSILRSNAGLVAFRYPGVHAFYRVGNSGSLSSSKIRELKKQYMVLRNIAGLSFLCSVFCIFFYIVIGLRKHFVDYR